ncbi:MAG: hypothetical protein M5U34_17240 [Chloroflexi bacterium]|nr:hypothetical protein [Chloroflexota bacterium]
MLNSSKPESTPTISAIFQKDYFVYPTLDATSEWYKLYGIDFVWEWEGHSLSSWEWDATIYYDNILPPDAFDSRNETNAADETVQEGGAYEMAAANRPVDLSPGNSGQASVPFPQPGEVPQGGNDTAQTEPGSPAVESEQAATPAPGSASPNQTAPLSTPRPAETPPPSAPAAPIISTLPANTPSLTPSLTPTPTTRPPPTPTFTPRPPLFVAAIPITRWDGRTKWMRCPLILKRSQSGRAAATLMAHCGDQTRSLCRAIMPPGFATILRQTRMKRPVFMQIRPLAEQPNRVKAWVYGDYSSHYLSIWILDRQQETWQIPLGLIEHTGWKEMEVAFTGADAVEIQHISGPENHRIRFPHFFPRHCPQ